MLLGLCAAILVAGAMVLAQSLVVPILFAVFAIALVWPLQRRLAGLLTGPLAMLVTMAFALVTLVGMALLIAWAFGGVAQWVVANSAQLQALYAQKLAFLAAQGIEVASVFAENFNTRWLVRIAQEITGQLQGILSFTIVTLVFLVLGLLEVEVVQRQMARMPGETPAALLRAAALTAQKFRIYMLVRSIMSVVTGLCVWGFASFMGLDLAAEWGVIAFVLNYIPFIGPLVATLFPTLFAILQFASWEVALVVFVSLNVIQTVSGSYIEPLLAGKTLAVSSFMVLLAVFLGSFLWGIPGAFIGVPVLIAALTICQEFPRSRWVADLLSGRDPGPA
ncbi:AI-2E family transporter [Roseococcus sp. SDR]|uniref:AI-2E family transporter n=1 Tax=Roseococcus sp. SDR TaxID=2835532 RepID=UPI001BCF4AF5|nr:AI-2E family transporter [Roseococcus sp. SDR]MBS7793055.1 AI-2E family transporter [Roseococcus sp. SDR]MBV1848369.1 AI-2E family transporter [Roseococcus sp. SDR]